MTINLKEIRETLADYKLNCIDDELDVTKYNESIQNVKKFIDFDVERYLKTIPKIADKYLPLTTDKLTFIKEELDYDQQLKLKSIEKHYMIELQKQLLEQGLSPMLVYLQPKLQNIPEDISKIVKLVNEWFIYKNFIKLEDKHSLDFKTIQYNLLLMVNPDTLTSYEKKFKQLLQYYPTVDAKSLKNNIELETHLQYFDQKAMELCYLIQTTTGYQTIEEIQKTVYIIMQQLKKYHTLMIYFIIDLIILYITLQDMRQYVDVKPLLKELDKTVLVSVIGSRYDPQKGILFMNLKRDNPTLMNEQNELYNKFCWQFPHWNVIL